jgi:DNA-binding beta-propeller fold protein YncE
MKATRMFIGAAVCALAGLCPASYGAVPTAHHHANGVTLPDGLRVAHTRWQAAARHGSDGQRAVPQLLVQQRAGATGAKAVRLGTGAQSFAIDARTGTAYVSSDEGTVSVVDVRHCNARRSRSCKGPIAELAGPSDGIGVAVYRRSLYVASGVGGTNGLVSVYDIAHCRVADISGCGSAVAKMPVADIPVGLAVDRASGTLYVGNVADHVDVLDLRSCRRADLSGCGSADVGSIPATNGPVFPTLGVNHTLYVPANGPGADGSGDSVHVIDLRHCHVGDIAGCGASEATLPADGGAVVAHLDKRTGTLYVQNQGADTVSVLDVRRCTGARHSGCSQTPPQIPVGANPSGGFVETRDGRMYVANSDSDTLSTFATRECRAGDTTGCPTSPPRTARANGAPFWLAYDARTRTIFTVEHSGRALGVLRSTVCSHGRRGCQHLLPSIAGDEQQLAVTSVHTWYGTDEKGNLTLTDTRACTPRHARRCAAAAIHTSEPNTSFGQLVADDRTHSLYMIANDPDTFRGSLVVLDTGTCNARVHTNCSPVAPAMPLPDFTAVIALDPSTHTVYVSTQADSTLQVVDGTRCNAKRQTACSAPVGQVPLDGVAFGVAVDPSARTVYVSEFGADFDSDIVYAVNSTHCRSTDASGCGHAPKQFTSDLAPLGLVVDTTRHSLYVLASGGGDQEGKIDVYDTRTCNARGIRRCTPTDAFQVGRSPYVGALDPRTDRLFVADFEHAAVSVIGTRRCNASITRGCRDRQLDVGDSPADVAIDPRTHSVFVLNGLYQRTSYVDTRVRP